MEKNLQDLLSKKLQTNPDFLIREVGGESVLVPIGDAGIFDNSIISLNETLAYLWNFFTEEAHTTAEAIEKAKEEFDAPEGEIERDIISFVVQSVNLGLLQEGEE